MRHKHTSWLSLMTVLAMVATPSRLMLAKECPFLSQDPCAHSSPSDAQEAGCCCDITFGSVPRGAGSEGKTTQDSEQPAGECQCLYYCVTTVASAIDAPLIPITSVLLVASHQYLSETVHPSDWVSRILRPPSC